MTPPPFAARRKSHSALEEPESVNLVLLLPLFEAVNDEIYMLEPVSSHDGGTNIFASVEAVNHTVPLPVRTYGGVAKLIYITLPNIKLI